MLQIRQDFNLKQKTRLKNTVIKYQQIINNIDLPIKELENKTSQELIMDLRTDNNEKVFIAIKKSQQGNYALLVKRRYKEKASPYVLYLLSWLFYFYRKKY